MFSDTLKNTLFVVLLLFFVSCAIPLPPTRSDTPSNSLYHVAGCQNGFVACAKSRCWYSSDGLRWRFDRGAGVTIPNVSLDIKVKKMKAAQDYIVALTNEWALSNFGGNSWKISLHAPYFDYLECLSGRCYGVNNDGTVWATADGNGWEELYRPFRAVASENFEIYDVTTERGKVFALDRNKGVMVLDETAHWIPAQDGPHDLAPATIEGDRIGKCASNGQTIVAISAKAIYYSRGDGNWSAAPLPLDQIQSVLKEWRLWDVCYAKGLFVGVGEGELVLTSEDGESWSLRSINKTKYELEPNSIIVMPVVWPKRWF